MLEIDEERLLRALRFGRRQEQVIVNDSIGEIGTKDYKGRSFVAYR
jgi:hypothetical protein